MRSNSGKDESRNNLRDPTLRDKELAEASNSVEGSEAKAPADRRTGHKD